MKILPVASLCVCVCCGLQSVLEAVWERSVSTRTTRHFNDSQIDRHLPWTNYRTCRRWRRFEQRHNRICCSCVRNEHGRTKHWHTQISISNRLKTIAPHLLWTNEMAGHVETQCVCVVGINGFEKWSMVRWTIPHSDLLLTGGTPTIKQCRDTNKMVHKQTGRWIQPIWWTQHLWRNKEEMRTHTTNSTHQDKSDQC